jgi:hypothetical protein
VIAADRLRPPSSLDLSAEAYKDWLHVNVFDFERDRIGLVNVSLHGNPRDRRSLAAAAVLLGDLASGWSRHLTVLSAVEAEVSDEAVVIGDTARISLDPASGGVGLLGRVPELGIELEAVGWPAAAPIVAEQPTTFGSGWISWRAMPRMKLVGRITAGGERASADTLVAYHDHNWGRWYWGDDAGWEWGAFLAPDEVTFVTTRPTDRAHRAGASALRAQLGTHTRSFRERTVRVGLEGRLERPPGRVPGAMAALHAARRFPRLPARVLVEADDGYDRVELDARFTDATQLITAEPARPGYGFIHELLGCFDYRVRLDGEERSGEGLAAFEYVD